MRTTLVKEDRMVRWSTPSFVLFCVASLQGEADGQTVVPEGLTSGARVAIVNAKSGLCLTIAGGGTTNNAEVVQYLCDDHPSRFWTLSVVQGTDIVHVKNVNSGLCLTVAGGGTDRNVTSVQYPCDDHPSRRWRYTGVDDKTFRLVNVNSNLCLTIAGGGSNANDRAVQFPCDGHPSRDWRFRIISATAEPRVPEELTSGARVALVNANSGLCLTIAGGGTTNNDEVVQYLCDDHPSRFWTFSVVQGTGIIHVKNLNSGLCLTVAGGSTDRNVTSVQYPCDDHPSRRWRYTSVDDKTFRLVNVNSNLCLTIAGGGSDTNARAVQFPCDGHPSRDWRLRTAR
jgi:cytolethal distending toxin subunit A